MGHFRGHKYPKENSTDFIRLLLTAQMDHHNGCNINLITPIEIKISLQSWASNSIPDTNPIWLEVDGIETASDLDSLDQTKIHTGRDFKDDPHFCFLQNLAIICAVIIAATILALTIHGYTFEGINK